MPETVENKEKQEKPSSAASVPGPGKSSLFPLLARLGVVVGALAWGLALAHALSGFSTLGQALLTIDAGTGRQEFFRLGGVLAGVGLAGVLAWLGLGKFGSRLNWKKPGLGKWARGSALAGIGVLAAFGAFSFYMVPPTTSLWWADLWKAKLSGLAFSVKPILFPAAGILMAALYGVYLFLNRDRTADFLIETEGELRKVSWPARKEYLGSSLVVLIVVVVVSLFLTAVDNGLSWLMQKARIGF